MIAKNEEASLGRCLASVRDLVDEMVVVDTGSTDGTVAVAEAFGARIGHFPWRDDFAAARNESLGLCSGDWVLLLDADETVDRADHGEIRRALERGEVGGFTLVSRNYTRDGSARLFDQPVVPNPGGYQEGAGLPFCADQPMLRLVRRLPELRFEGRIHELLEPCLRRQRLAVGALAAVIHHYGKLDPERETAKSAYYLELARRDAQERPSDPGRQFNLMVQAETAGHWETVLAAGSAVLHLSRQVPHAVRTALAVACQEMGRHQEALDHLGRVLAAQPDHPLALCRLPRSLAALGRRDEARAGLAKAMAACPQDPAPCLELGRLEEQEGRVQPAREALCAAAARRPQDPLLRQALVELDLRHRLEAQAAADAMEALRALPGQGGGHWHALAAGFLLRSGHAGPGRAVLDLGLASFPGHPGLLGLAAALAAPEGVAAGASMGGDGMKFNMGCGHNKRAGYTNIDQSAVCVPDQVVDLEATPWPWPDDCAGEVVFNHSLEHMGGDPKVFLAIMKELYRICRHDARVIIHVPHPRHDNFLGDPTHVRPITPQVLTLFSRSENDRWARTGAANSPLAHYLGVDFELVGSTVELDEPYRTELDAGRMTQEQVRTALREKNNVGTEFRIELKVRKAPR